MKLNNKGFGAIEAVLIIVAIAILGFVGYKAYRVYTQSEPNTTQSVDHSENLKEEEDDAEETYLEIKEWGVKFPVVESTGLKFKLDKDESGDSALLHATSLGEYEGCGETEKHQGFDRFNNIGTLYRMTSPEKGPNATQPDAELGNFYYYYYPNQMYCYIGESESVLDEVSAKTETIQKEIEAAVKNLSAIQQ